MSDPAERIRAALIGRFGRDGKALAALDEFVAENRELREKLESALLAAFDAEAANERLQRELDRPTLAEMWRAHADEYREQMKALTVRLIQQRRELGYAQGYAQRTHAAEARCSRLEAALREIASTPYREVDGSVRHIAREALTDEATKREGVT